MSDFSVEGILEFYREDKKEAVNLLYERYYRPLVFYSGKLLQDSVTAEDVVQEFFTSLWENDYLSGVAPSALPSYLYTSVRNKSLQRLEKIDILRHSRQLGDVTLAAEVFSEIDEGLIARLKKEVSQLPPRTREVMNCVIVREMKYRQAADELGISINTVKTLLKDGLSRLRRQMNAKTRGVVSAVQQQSVLRFILSL